MGGEIINKIDSAGLVTLDLSDFIVAGQRIGLDLANWLDDELIIRESSFKDKLDDFNWQTMNNAFVAVFTSSKLLFVETGKSIVIEFE